MKASLCCYSDQEKLTDGCKRESEYQIWSGNGPEDYTESCFEHLEDMLDNSIYFHVFRIDRLAE